MIYFDDDSISSSSFIMLPRYYKQDTDIRKQQINTLKIFNDNVRTVEEEKEYEVPFVSGENDFTLKISLGTDFPNENPHLRICPSVVHPWVSADGTITGAPGLLNYTIHSDLGRVVQAITREFQRNPPELTIKSSSNNSKNEDTLVYSNSFRQPTQNIASQVSFAQPQISTVFPELNNLSLNELAFLNENEDCQTEFVDNLSNIKEQNQTIDKLMMQIKEISENNLQKREQLLNSRTVINSKIDEVTKLSFETERLHTVYQNFSEKYSPRNIQEELNKAAKKSDLESEKIAEEFLAGNIDVDKFVSSFIKSKSMSQLRKTKEEKLNYQLDRLEKAGF